MRIKIQKNPELMNQLTSQFPELTPELAEELDCADYKEKVTFKNLMDFFKRDRINIPKDTVGTNLKKKSIFKRIFGTKRTKRRSR